MGMMIAGKWQDNDDIHQGDEYVRPVSNCHTLIDANEIINCPKRFYLIASWSCPWSHRTMIYRQLAGLATYLPLHITGGKKVQGYAANHGEIWQIPGAEKLSKNYITHLHELYHCHDSHYTGRSTVPILWDSWQLKIVSNESNKIIALLQAAGEALDKQTSTTRKVESALNQGALVELNLEIYENLSNGVYKAAFAKSQPVYDKAVAGVFKMLETLDQRLQSSTFLMGDKPSEADWLLFPTLVRFDIDYYSHSGCSYKHLSQYPNLWRYARCLYNMPGMAQTVNFAAIHTSNYHCADIKPIMPEQDWSIKQE